MRCLHAALRNLLANPFNCNCYLAWLGEWLRKKRIVTGNPRCQKPYFLKEIPIQDVAIQDFTCDDGKKALLNPRAPAVHVTSPTLWGPTRTACPTLGNKQFCAFFAFILFVFRNRAHTSSDLLSHPRPLDLSF